MLPHSSPQERLRQTRQQLRELIANEGVNPPRGDFPRSATMRWLLEGSGAGVAGAVVSAMAIGILPRAGKLLRFIPLTSVARLLFQRTHSAARGK